MQQSPSLEANSFSAIQEILRSLWNPNFLYCLHQDMRLDPNLSQIDPFHVPYPIS